MPNYPAPGTSMGWRGNAVSFNGPVQSQGMTGSSVGSMIGKIGGGIFGMGLGGPIGALGGAYLGNKLGGFAGAGLSSLFGPHGIPAALRGISLLTGRPAGSVNPGAPAGGGITASAGGWNIDANGNLIGGTQGAGPQLAHAAHTTAIPGFAMSNMADVRARNII